MIDTPFACAFNTASLALSPIKIIRLCFELRPTLLVAAESYDGSGFAVTLFGIPPGTAIVNLGTPRSLSERPKIPTTGITPATRPHPCVLSAIELCL